jgi:hypothetical protein
MAEECFGVDCERYLSRGLHRISGYLHKGAALLIVQTAYVQSRLNVTGHVAEIGVHEGRLFVLLCLLRSHKDAAVAVDVFERQHLNRDRSGHGNFERLQDNLRKYVRHGSRAILISADSRDVSSASLVEAAGGRFRLFSIDGGHEAETVFHDLAVAAGALCHGGVILLDDFFNEGWPGVADGTCRFFASQKFPDLVPFAVAQNKVLIGERTYAENYRKALMTAMKGQAKTRESTLFGHNVTYFDFRYNRFWLITLQTIHLWLERHPDASRLFRRVRDAL